MSELIRVEDLRVVACGERGEVEIVKGVSFSLKKGEVLALIGESGSGKTTIALALLGYARRGCRLSGGVVQVGEHDMRALSEKQLQGLRGNRVSYIAQSAAAAFNPAKRLIDQVVEGALIHGLGTRAELHAKAIGLFRDLALPGPERIGQRYPHQVSGGQLQRVMAAMALISDPLLVVLDEPTTALDVTTRLTCCAPSSGWCASGVPRPCMSLTTWPWWRKWLTRSWYSMVGRSSNRAPRRRCSKPRPMSTRAACWQPRALTPPSVRRAGLPKMYRC